LNFKRFVLVFLISFLSPSDGWAEDDISWRVTNPSLTALYSEGLNSAQSGQGIVAGQHSLIYNNAGIVPEEGLNFYFSLSLSGKGGPFEAALEPLFFVDWGITPARGAHGTIHKGYLRFTKSALHLDIGKESLWWGQGAHGSLFLTNNAKPLPMLRLFSNPTLLPNIFRYLGPFQFDIFFSQLEADRVIPKPYFQGTRITIKPHPILDLGFTRTIMMGGEGPKGINPSQFITIWFGENKEGGEDSSNSIAGIDFRLTLPDAQFYGEVGGEDEAGGYPSKDAFLLGVYLPENNFRIEYADISNPAWYVHSLYQSGYTYKGRILGHHVGGGGRDLFIEKGLIKTESVHGKINLDYEERGIVTAPVMERHYQVGTAFQLNAGIMIIPWTGQINFAYDWIHNAGYALGFNQENALFMFSFIGQI